MSGAAGRRCDRPLLCSAPAAALGIGLSTQVGPARIIRPTGPDLYAQRRPAPLCRTAARDRAQSTSMSRSMPASQKVSATGRVLAIPVMAGTPPGR